MSDIPQFALDFSGVVVSAFDKLARVREVSHPNDLVLVSERADANIEGLHAILLVGSREAIDRAQKEFGL